MYVITYTKKNVSFLAFIITVLIFILFQMINSLFFPKEQKKNAIYSRTIPTYVNDNETILKSKIHEIESEINIAQNMKELQEGIELVQQEANQESNNELDSQNVAIQNQEQQPESQVQQAENNNQTTKTQRQQVQENKAIKWRVQIPKLNLDVHIQEGTSSDILLKSVGHFEETSKWKGNVGLAAHNRGYQCNFFQNIKNLKIGDEIIYTTTNGKKVYQVQINKIISETNWSYLQETTDNRITLITCEENRREYRRCVQAVEVASYVQ